MTNHTIASAVNRLVVSKGLVRPEAGQASYWRLRTLISEGNLQTVEELWQVVQARIARRDASLQAAKDARKALEAAEAAEQAELALEGDIEVSSLPCSGLAECFCDGCEQERSEMAQEQYERSNA